MSLPWAYDLGPTQKNLIAGSCAGCASLLACHPLDTVRTRLQTTGGSQFSGAIDCFVKTVRGEGALALYKGMAFPFAAQGVYKVRHHAQRTRRRAAAAARRRVDPCSTIPRSTFPRA